MEDVKWLLKKWGFLILMLLIAGVICWGKLHTEKRKVAEEVWEPPAEIGDSEMITEEEMIRKLLQIQHIGLFHKLVIVLFRKRKKSSCKVQFCRRQNRLKKSIKM